MVKIEVVNEIGAEIDLPMLNACIAKVVNWGESPNIIGSRILTGRRTESGWLEYSILIDYNDETSFIMGAIQRKPDATIEFHS